MVNIEVGNKGISVTARPLALEQSACWVMGGLLGGSGLYAYSARSSLPSLLAGLSFASIYSYSGYLIKKGRAVDGVDLSIVASAALLLLMGPRAYRTKGRLPVALSAAGAAVLGRMGYVSYCLRHGQ